MSEHFCYFLSLHAGAKGIIGYRLGSYRQSVYEVPVAMANLSFFFLVKEEHLFTIPDHD